MQQAVRWSSETVKRLLEDMFGVHVEEEPGGDLFAPAGPGNPAIHYDSSSHKLTLEYPDEYEELPNPGSAKFYPDFEREYPTPEAVKNFVRESSGRRSSGGWIMSAVATTSASWSRLATCYGSAWRRSSGGSSRGWRTARQSTHPSAVSPSL